MTLYWWMHWFWITAIILQVLVSLFSSRSLVHASTVPLAPIVQNGHQNGPYRNELPTEHGLSTFPSQPSTVSEPNTRYFIKSIANSNVNGTQESTPSQQTPTKPPMSTSDQIATEPPANNKSLPATHKITPLTDNITKQNDKSPFKKEDISTSEVPVVSTATFSFPDTNDNDDIAHTFLQSGPLVEGSLAKGDKDSKIIWVDKLPSKAISFHGKHTKLDQIDEKTGKETLFEEVPMNDGPFNPTGSFINSTNIRVKTVVSTSKTPEMTTFKESHLTSVDGESEGDTKEMLSINTTTDGAVVFVTPTTDTDHSENTNNIFHATEYISGGNNVTESTESILEEDYNSTFVVGDNSTFVAKTDSSIPDNSHKNSSHRENAISAVSFDHSNIEESTKVSSGIVQSVIDDSVNSRGKTLNAVAITAIVIGVIVGFGLVGGVSCVVYRRRYLNNPQTLNDKCSNPDSSGYIDDSTLRENSEEMYSLDNDSFLNSLEAMTIQNYWTDNVKHTKL